MKICLLIFFYLLIQSSLFSDGIQPNGTGTEEDPYQIAILDNILWISTNYESWDCHLLQTENIDATDTQNWNSGEGFQPIGFSNNEFMGFYNGQNFVIDGLYVNRPDEINQSLFGEIFDASLINIGIINSVITGSHYSSSLAGSVVNSTISNCYSSGIVNGAGYVGGLIGYCFETDINNCFSSCDVNGSSKVGGLIGFSSLSSIDNCNSTGIVIGQNSNVGGFIGKSEGDDVIHNCNSFASVSGGINVGGFIGESQWSSIIECYSHGTVSGENQTGGFVGSSDISNINQCFSTASVNGTVMCTGGFIGYLSEGNINNCYSIDNEIIGGFAVGGFAGNIESTSIYNSYCTGTVSGLTDVGAFVGYNFSDEIFNNFWNIETSGVTNGVGSGNNANGITGKTTEEMINIATFTDLSSEGLETPWDFFNNPYDDTANEDYWYIDELNNSGYPFHSWQLNLPFSDFEADLTYGFSPLEVHFIDLSTYRSSHTSREILSWEWDFDNNGTIDSIEQNPTFTYLEEGIYSVSLTISDSINSNTEVKLDYIDVNVVNSEEGTIISNTTLISNYPNPFNPKTTISYSLNLDINNTTIKIYNLKGQLVDMLDIRSNSDRVEWDAVEFPSGVYLYRIDLPDSPVEKMLLLK